MRNSLLLALITTAILNGCGGGGESATQATSTPPTVASSNPPPVVEVATPAFIETKVQLGFDAPAHGIEGCITPASSMEFSPETGFTISVEKGELEFFNLLNHLRCKAGINPLNRAGTLDRSAVGHANYSSLNQTVAHDQIPGATAFTGSNPGLRMAAAGYPINETKAPVAWGEVVAKTGASSREAVEGLTAAIYHRFVMLSPQFDEVGVALQATGRNYDIVSVANFAANREIKANQIVAFPANNQINVPVAFNTDYEIPDPLAGKSFVGYPISIQLDRGQTLRVQQFELRKAGSSIPIPAYVRGLGAEADAHLEGHTAFLMAHEPLEHGTRYEVRFIGSATEGANPSRKVEREWSFITAAREEIAVAETNAPVQNKFTRIKLNGCGATYSWRFTNGLEIKMVSYQWMEVRPTRTGAQWIEVTDACGSIKKIEFNVQG